MLRRPLAADYLILSALVRVGPCTAYEVNAWVRTTTAGEWELSQGALYPAIRRLVGGGFVSSERIEDDRAGRPAHRLEATPTGAAAHRELGLLVGRFGITDARWMGGRE